MMRIRALAFLAVVTGPTSAGVTLAQTAPAPPPAIVHVRVADTSGAPLQGVVITILKARQQDAVFVATSDAAGRHTFAVTPDSVKYQLVVRKLGYVQTARLVPVAPGDTMSFDLRLARNPPQLDTIRVRAQEDVKHKEQFIDADAIAHSPRPLSDAIDIINKLRPAMVWGVAGPREHCEPASNVWINGTLIQLPSVNEALIAPKRMAAVSLPGASSPRVAANGPSRGSAAAAIPIMPAKSAMAAMPLSALSILSSINPDHIESMEYHDCGDMSVGAVKSTSALFIVLKPGIGYSDGRGSYVDTTKAPPPR